jgi:hypothetical protein
MNNLPKRDHLHYAAPKTDLRNLPSEPGAGQLQQDCDGRLRPTLTLCSKLAPAVVPPAQSTGRLPFCDTTPKSLAHDCARQPASIALKAALVHASGYIPHSDTSTDPPLHRHRFLAASLSSICRIADA